MITVSAFFAFAGFLSAYNTSKKAVRVGNSAIETALRNNVSEAKKAAVAMFLLSFTLCILCNGIGAGTLLFFIFLMISGSLIVLLSPLKMLTLRVAAIAFAIFAVIEILFLI